MKLLKVPLYLQEPGSVDCGPVCDRMMLEYYGVSRSLEDLRQKVQYSAVGTSAFDNGSIFLAEGFKVTAVTAHPGLFPPDLQGQLAHRPTLLERLKQTAQDRPEKADCIATLEKYLGLGGKLCMEIPAFRHIKAAIDAGNPVLALTFGMALGVNQGRFHFMIVNGYKRGHVYLTNPLPQAVQGWFPLDRFLYAVHTSTLVDLDNGSFIIPSR